MVIDEKQVKERKIVGKLGDEPVWEISMIGGLYLAATTGKKKKLLAMAPHPGMLQFMAEKAEPSLQWTALNKSENRQERFEHLFQKYEILTELVNKYL
jgi:hypothetical protein